MSNKYSYKFAFLGSSDFSVIVLDRLKTNGLLPTLIVTIEDKAQGRKMQIVPEDVKVWAQKENIPFLQLKTLKSEESAKSILSYFGEGADFFVVTHYSKFIPQNILDFPKNGILNIHPSLLPKLRGPSPIKSGILEENETGVTIIKLDEEMDHGPILGIEKIVTTEWPPYELELKKDLAVLGADMLTKTIPKLISGEIVPQEQDHSSATFCKKIVKTDGELDLNDPANTNLRKIRAYHDWPSAYFFKEISGAKKRVVVKKAHIENSELVFDRVVPEGKKEMNYSDFLRGIK